MRTFRLRLPNILLGITCASLLPVILYAANFSQVRDVISNSAPSATTTDHVLYFTTSTDIPLGGSIVVTLESNSGDSFTVPVGLDYTDIDLAIATSTAFVDRPLDSSVTGISDGVTVVSGSSGSITFTLGDIISGSIPGGSQVRVIIGGSATYGVVGDQYIVNPPGIRSYRVRVASYNGTTILDSGVAMIAVVSQVGVGPVDTTDLLVPVRSNGMPNGELLGSTPAVQISLQTNKDSICKYDTASGVSFHTMMATMTVANFGFLHYSTILGLTASTSYNYYIRCVNTSGSFNTDDYLIAFNLGGAIYTGSNASNSGVTASSINTTTNGPVAAPQGASSFSGPGPVGGPYLGQGQVTIDGDTFPGAKIVILKDGKVVKEETADSAGHFNQVFTGLDRATYTWGIYAVDPKAKASATFNSTIYLIGNSNNIIAPVYISPTIYGTSTIGVGDKGFIDGYALPKKQVRVLINKQGDVLNTKISVATTTADAQGRYHIDLPTEEFGKGTYEIKAQSIVDSKNSTAFSPTFYLGVGESPNLDFALRADLNKDKKVNLTDFSILLFNWKSSDPVADINQDGMVNLTDFSIMLANWTG